MKMKISHLCPSSIEDVQTMSKGTRAGRHPGRSSTIRTQRPQHRLPALRLPRPQGPRDWLITWRHEPKPRRLPMSLPTSIRSSRHLWLRRLLLLLFVFAVVGSGRFRCPVKHVLVGIGDWHGRFEGDNTKLAAEVVHGGVEGGFTSVTQTPVLPVST